MSESGDDWQVDWKDLARPQVLLGLLEEVEEEEPATGTWAKLQARITLATAGLQAELKYREFGELRELAEAYRDAGKYGDALVKATNRLVFATWVLGLVALAQVVVAVLSWLGGARV